MASSSGKQDLIVNIISADRRYEVANYKIGVRPWTPLKFRPPMGGKK